MFKKVLLIFGLLFLALGVFFLFFSPGSKTSKILSPLIRFNRPTVQPKPLEKYYFENLKKRIYSGTEIKFEKIIKEEEKYTAWLFSFQGDGKKVTGMANIPNQGTKFPVIVMLRGYADDEVYFTGLGTRKAAGVFAENGFLTLAPDFLGFGGSDSSSEDVLEARFTRPITILNLLASIESLPQANQENIFLWAHSNGGQIALSVLEISEKNLPTVLWAPVTKGFPQSILDYMDDYQNLDELGKQVYDRIQAFIQEYDSNQVSITNYFDQIQAPIQVYQGGSDDLVSHEWTEEFIKTMRGLNKKIEYFFYPNSDHHLKEDWDQVVEKNMEFFKE